MPIKRTKENWRKRMAKSKISRSMDLRIILYWDDVKMERKRVMSDNRRKPFDKIYSLIALYVHISVWLRIIMTPKCWKRFWSNFWWWNDFWGIFHGRAPNDGLKLFPFQSRNLSSFFLNFDTLTLLSFPSTTDVSAIGNEELIRE